MEEKQMNKPWVGCGSGFLVLGLVLVTVIAAVYLSGLPAVQNVIARRVCLQQASVLHSFKNYSINSLQMVSADEGWAVSSTGSASNYFVHLKAGQWSSLYAPTQVPLNSLHMLSVDEGWAVADQRFFHYSQGCWIDGGSIGGLRIPGRALLVGISMVSASDGWAVGSFPAHYDGQSWQEVAELRDASLNSVFMLSASEGWAVGSGDFFHYHGGSWERVRGAVKARSVFMVSAEQGWAVGEADRIAEYKDGSWTASQVPADSPVYSVSMVSADEGWAVGGGGGLSGPVSVMLHYVKGQWLSTTAPSSQPLTSVFMVSRDEGWASGLEVVLHYHDGSWRVVEP